MIDSHLTKIINSDIAKISFSEGAKIAFMRPIFKENGREKGENYGPVSILNCFSKIYEKHILEQFKPFLDDFLSHYMVAYKVHYSSSRALMRQIEQLKKSFDENFVAGTVLMDVPKVFDCIPHDLLIAKLQAYGFSKKNSDLHIRSI